MARLTLTPVQLPGTQGMVLSATTGAQSLSGFTGFQFVNNGGLFVALYIGSGGVGTVVQNFGRKIEGAIAAPPTVAVSNSTVYLFGPWSPSDFTAQDGSGLTGFDLTGTQTTNSITLYQLSPLS
jgi:hypothetical protein